MPQKTPKTYCENIAKMSEDNHNRIYHDNHYGFAITDDNELFGRLILEINQAGLSWTTIIKKQDNFRNAYSNFDIKKIAKYNNVDVERLLNDSGIIRNKLKITAVIFNAKSILSIKIKFKSFRFWLESNRGKNLDQWVDLFKKKFKFTGFEITREFLISTAFMEGAHSKECLIFNKIKKINH